MDLFVGKSMLKHLEKKTWIFPFFPWIFPWITDPHGLGQAKAPGIGPSSAVAEPFDEARHLPGRRGGPLRVLQQAPEVPVLEVKIMGKCSENDDLTRILMEFQWDL